MSSKEWRDGILNAPQPQPAAVALPPVDEVVDIIKEGGFYSDTARDILGLIEPRSLHEAQAGWWATRQDQLAARAQGYGHAFTPQPHWPLIPYQEAS